MASPLPPDPYAALGVAKDATAAAIKTQYRKLVLKFHPDKVQDTADKEAASDQFHKVQSAYEIVGDDERRARYDAQCKLADLRKEMMERGGAARPDVRTAAYKMPTESARGGDFYARGPERPTRFSPQYEERRPSYADDYFDAPPRPTTRREAEHERSAKRASPRDDRERTRASAKENERSSRREKSRRTEKEIRKDRDRKFATVTVEDASESDSDERMRTDRRMREDDDLKRERERYYETLRRQEEEAQNGFYPDARTHKIFTQHDAAKDYIERSHARAVPREKPDSERRPSPVRNSSSKDKVDSLKRSSEARPYVVRRGSDRPKSTGRDTQSKKASSRDKESKPVEIVDEPKESLKRPPTLNQSKSSPADIRPPFERQRSHSLQEHEPVHEQIPQVRRSETMPTSPPLGPTYDTRRKEPSKLRTEVKDGYPTPEPSPERQTRKYQYGQQYADDGEWATPDGYRTEVREPERTTRKGVARSPSPMKDRGRQRSTSSQYMPTQPPPMPRTTSYTYKYNGNGQGVESYTRPPPSRENSGRGENALFGEIRNVRSPRQSQSKYSPPPENVHYAQKVRPEDIKYQTGYSRRPSDRTFSRNNSGQGVSVR